MARCDTLEPRRSKPESEEDPGGMSVTGHDTEERRLPAPLQMQATLRKKTQSIMLEWVSCRHTRRDPPVTLAKSSRNAAKKRKEKSIESVGGVMAQGGVAYHQLLAPEAPPGLP